MTLAIQAGHVPRLKGCIFREKTVNYSNKRK